MRTYHYVCDNNKCQYEFEIEQDMSEDSLKKCPECGKAKLYRKIYTPFVFIKGEPTTVGHQADRNTQRLGHYEYEDKLAGRNNRIQKASDKLLEQTGGKQIERTNELPWWRSGKVEGLPKEDRPINIAKAKKIADDLGLRVTEPRKPKKKT
jgi:putative FmdB family regulatory protein